MKKINYQQLKSIFQDHESKHTGTHLTGYIVFTEDSFNQPYSLESRTYVVHSSSKAFVPGMGGYSIYGSALDGSDSGVRLEAYMALERGGKNGWKVDYCYLEDESVLPDEEDVPKQGKPMAKCKWRVGVKRDGLWVYRTFKEEVDVLNAILEAIPDCEKVSISKIREKFKL